MFVCMFRIRIIIDAVINFSLVSSFNCFVIKLSNVLHSFSILFDYPLVRNLRFFRNVILNRIKSSVTSPPPPPTTHLHHTWNFVAVMDSTPLILVVLFTFVLSFCLLNRYGNLAKQNVWITTSVFVAWFFSFNIIFILPLDITSTIYNQCINELNKTASATNQSIITLRLAEGGNATSYSNITDIRSACKTPWSYIPSQVLLALWQFIYWSSQVLTWILLPIFQSYSMSGEFTAFRKIKSAFIANIKYYCFFGVLFIIFLFYYASQERITFEGLKVFCISASNTFGLFLLTVLMGYGLVEIPRSCILNYYCDYQYKLKYFYFKVAKSNGEKCEAEGNLDDLHEEIWSLYNYAVKSNHQAHFVGHLEAILRKCPSTPPNSSTIMTSQEMETKLNEKNLIKLNAKIKRAMQMHHRTNVQYSLLVKSAIELQEIIESGSFRLSPIELCILDKIPQFEWILQRKAAIYRVISLLVGCVLAAISVMIIWSEFTFFIQSIPISLFALIVKLLGYNYLWIEIFSMLSIAYLCTCCYYTVFKIRIFNYYYLAKHQQTDEYSLIFCGMMLCRLASPLCLNFLSLTHLDSHITKQSVTQETSFTKIMGHMDTISFISDHLSIYLPVLMSLFCIVTFFKLGHKIVHYFGIEQFLIADEFTQDFITQGNSLVKREIQKLRRSQTTSGGGNSHLVSVSARQNVLNRRSSQEQLLDANGSPDHSPESVPPPPPIVKQYGINRNLFDDV